VNRLFAAVPLEQNVLKALKAPLKELSHYKGIVRPVSEGHLHITIKFIGDTDDTRTDALCRHFSSLNIHKDDTSPRITLKGVGAFPSLARASVLWCGIKDDEILQKLYRSIEEYSVSHGCNADTRSFSPHITLARIARDKKPPETLINYFKFHSNHQYAFLSVKRAVLYKSVLTPQGPLYTEIAECLI
jgi:2'-5' RNA ligase